MNHNNMCVRFLILLAVLSIFYSCNNIPEAILLANTERVDTLDHHDYKYIVDKKNRRGYVTIENEIMEGRYVIKRKGIMTEEFTIKGGFLNGQRILYYENGHPETFETYKTSVQHGPVTMFYKNGSIKSKTSYDNGEAAIEETHYNESGDISFKKVETDGVIYQHSYRDGNRIISTFEKMIDEQVYEIIIKYDSFGTVELILGKMVANNSPMLYIFDVDYKQIDGFNGQEEPLKAQQYLSAFQSW